MIVEFLGGWALGAFLLFMIFELTMPTGQLKKWPRRILLVIYIPLYVIAAPFYVGAKIYERVRGGEEL